MQPKIHSSSSLALVIHTEIQRAREHNYPFTVEGEYCPLFLGWDQVGYPHRRQLERKVANLYALISPLAPLFYLYVFAIAAQLSVAQ